jgi:uncharacterized membrane protein HdeD (DUF308 family)
MYDLFNAGLEELKTYYAVRKERVRRHSGARLVARDWWVYAVRGIAAIVFGALLIAFPGEGLIRWSGWSGSARSCSG